LPHHFTVLPPHPRSTLFPYTTLFRSSRRSLQRRDSPNRARPPTCRGSSRHRCRCTRRPRSSAIGGRREKAPLRRLSPRPEGRASDRKSTRLNSSHLGISYAVFCLKKK